LELSPPSTFPSQYLLKIRSKALKKGVKGQTRKKAVMCFVKDLLRYQKKKQKVKSASTIGPGKDGTSYLTDFGETWPV